jgi:hypothetical protein
MKDEKSTIAGSTSRNTFRKWKTNVHVRRAVIRSVPMNASNAAALSVMVGSMIVARLIRNARNNIPQSRWPGSMPALVGDDLRRATLR